MRRRKKIPLVVGILLVVLLKFLFPPLEPQAEKPHAKTSSVVLAEGEAEVLRVVDGDTLQVLFRGGKEHIRLIGIDTPESHLNDKAIRDSNSRHQDMKKILADGSEAAAFVKRLVTPGSLLSIQLDVTPRDKYQRLLGYVYLKDGRMLNEVIIREGYAYPLTIPPNVKHAELFQEAFKDSRVNRRGLWR